MVVQVSGVPRPAAVERHVLDAGSALGHEVIAAHVIGQRAGVTYWR